MAVKTLFLVSSILAASTLCAAAVELLNPHDVLNKTRRDMNAFDQRMKGYKAEQQKKEKEAEAKRKNEEAERQKRENAEKALQEAQSRKEEAEKQKREKAEKAVQDAQLKREAAEQRKREREAKAQQAAQKKRDATAAKPAQGASPSPVPTTPPPSSTGVSEPSSTSQP
jgi:septal ring factor EnvC (AmiA/AmiB activator)